MRKTITLLLLLIINVAFAQIPNYVPTSNLIGWWPFSGNANDTSGNSNNGSVTGATLTTDRFGTINSCYSFTGTTNKISISNQFFNNGWTNYSISMWFNPSLNSLNGCLFNTVPHDGIGIAYSNYGTNKKLYHNKNSNTSVHLWNILNQDPFNYPSFEFNNWYNIMIIKTNTTYQYYVNGTLDKTINSTILPLSNICGLVFGNIAPGYIAEPLNGKLDDIGIWDRALTQTEITALYKGVLSSETFSKTTNFQLYPNPANDVVQFKSTAMVEKISIYNALGQLVQENKINSMEGAISIEHLAQGSYFVKFNNQKTSYTLLKK